MAPTVFVIKVVESRSTQKLLATTLCVIFMILVSHENVKKCVLGVCTITSKTKITLAFEASSALPHENETKIVKITLRAKSCISQY